MAKALELVNDLLQVGHCKLEIASLAGESCPPFGDFCGLGFFCNFIPSRALLGSVMKSEVHFDDEGNATQFKCVEETKMCKNKAINVNKTLA